MNVVRVDFEMKFFILMVILLFFPAVSFAAPPVNHVCLEPDFRAFIEQYSRLSKEEQNTCVKYPVEIDYGESDGVLKNQAALSDYYFGERKYVLASHDFDSDDRPTGAFFSSGDPSTITAGKFGYLFRWNSEGDGAGGMQLRLISGHEFLIHEYLRFNFIDDAWFLTAVYIEDADEEAAEQLAPGQTPATPERLDISGFKLGRPGGPGLKKEIEALAEGYKCMDINAAVDQYGNLNRDPNSNKSLIGYSCFAPQPPSSPFIIPLRVRYDREESDLKAISAASKHLVVLFAEDAGNIWFIYKKEKFADGNKAPLLQTMYDALLEKYGSPTPVAPNGEPLLYIQAGTNEFGWALDRTGDKISKYVLHLLTMRKTGLVTLPSRIGETTTATEVESPYPRTEEYIGEILVSLLYSENNNGAVCHSYSLSLFDAGYWHDRHLAAQKTETEQKEAIGAPNF